jgi:hypothetical protein
VNRRVHQHKVGKFRDTNILGVYMSSNVVVYGVTGSSRFFRLVWQRAGPEPCNFNKQLWPTPIHKSPWKVLCAKYSLVHHEGGPHASFHCYYCNCPVGKRYYFHRMTERSLEGWMMEGFLGLKDMAAVETKPFGIGRSGIGFQPCSRVHRTINIPIHHNRLHKQVFDIKRRIIFLHLHPFLSISPSITLRTMNPPISSEYLGISISRLSKQLYNQLISL